MEVCFCWPCTIPTASRNANNAVWKALILTIIRHLLCFSSSIPLVRGFLMPLGIDGWRQRIQMSEKRHRSPDFVVRGIVAGNVRRELAAPGKPPGAPHAASRDPKELVVRLAGRMQCKLRRVGIEIHIGFVFGGGIRSAVAARAIVLEKLYAGHQIILGRRDGVR